MDIGSPKIVYGKLWNKKLLGYCYLVIEQNVCKKIYLKGNHWKLQKLKGQKLLGVYSSGFFQFTCQIWSYLSVFIYINYKCSRIAVIVDSNGSNCQEALFAISPSTTTTRSWTIRVTQYTCGEEDSSGPPGCLQWYTSTSNYIQK